MHELVVPFEARRSPDVTPPAPRAASPGSPSAADAPPAPRRFPPGSEWLYLKIYTGTGGVDALLRALAPVIERALASGAARRWFFIRFGDPDWHLRLRFEGEPARLLGDVLPAVHAAIAPLADEGGLWRVQLDTYEREVERYGGPEGVVLAERLFQVDSEAALAIVRLLDGDEGADARWRLALCGVDALLGDLGLDLAARHAAMTRTRDVFGREFGLAVRLARQLGDRFRRERASLEALLDPARGAASPLAPGLAILAERSRRLAPVVADLAAAAAGRLTVPVAHLATSYVHMHCNRLLRAAARAQELVIYDLLTRVYASRIARTRRQPPGAP